MNRRKFISGVFAAIGSAYLPKLSAEPFPPIPNADDIANSVISFDPAGGPCRTVISEIFVHGASSTEILVEASADMENWHQLPGRLVAAFNDSVYVGHDEEQERYLRVKVSNDGQKRDTAPE